MFVRRDVRLVKLSPLALNNAPRATFFQMMDEPENLTLVFPPNPRLDMPGIRFQGSSVHVSPVNEGVDVPEDARG